MQFSGLKSPGKASDSATCSSARRRNRVCKRDEESLASTSWTGEEPEYS
jgi:hypothetical protein